MRLAFSTLPIPGHLNPMTALGRRLWSRGHEVIFLAVPDAEPAIRAVEGDGGCAVDDGGD